MQGTWFKDWFNSPYYHQLYANRDEREAADFINKIIEKLAPAANARMLDVACGKGRHSLQLADKGFDVTGIDLSRESINEALQHETDNLHFFVHDMRLPFWINYFDYAFNFFTSFGYFDTQREHDNAIRTITTSLKDKGIFVMDFLNASLSCHTGVTTMEKQIGNTFYQISKWNDERYLYKKIVVNDADLPEPLEYTEKVARFTRADFEQMFNRHGLNITAVYGDYQLNDYRPNESPRLIMHCIKNG